LLYARFNSIYQVRSISYLVLIVLYWYNAFQNAKLGEYIVPTISTWRSLGMSHLKSGVVTPCHQHGRHVGQL
jgi:hypothetical protein